MGWTNLAENSQGIIRVHDELDFEILHFQNIQESKIGKQFYFFLNLAFWKSASIMHTRPVYRGFVNK